MGIEDRSFALKCIIWSIDDLVCVYLSALNHVVKGL